MGGGVFGGLVSFYTQYSNVLSRVASGTCSAAW